MHTPNYLPMMKKYFLKLIQTFPLSGLLTIIIAFIAAYVLNILEVLPVSSSALVSMMVNIVLMICIMFSLVVLLGIVIFRAEMSQVSKNEKILLHT